MRRTSIPWILLLVALGLRLAYVQDIRATPTFESPLVDAYTYDRAARRIASEGPGAIEVPYYQPPLYPMLLGAVYALSSGSYVAPRLLHAVLGAGTVLLVFLLASRAAGRRAGWIAGLLLTFYGPVLYFEGQLLPPALVLALDTAALFLLAEADRRGDVDRRPAGAALLLGLSAAARPTALILAAGAGLWWFRRPVARAARGFRHRLLPALALLAPILPVTLANVLGGHEPVLVSWNGGINFYLGNGSDPDSLASIQPGFAWDRLQREPLRAGVRSRRGESAYWVRRALKEVREDPGGWAAALGRKALRLLDVRETPRNTDYRAFRPSSRILSLPLVGFGLAAPLALLGLVARGAGRIRGLLGIALAAVGVENLLFFVAGRYRLEAVPALCILAGVGVDTVLRDGRKAFGARALALFAVLAVVVHVDFLGERGIDEARAAINRGVALRRLGLTASARGAFREALRSSPADADAHRWLGEIALGERDPARALDHFDRALAVAPDYLRVLLGKARALEELGRRPEAETTYRAAVAVDPWSADVRLNYGVFLAIEGRRDEARRSFEEGLRIDPDDGRLRRNLRRLLEGG